MFYSSIPKQWLDGKYPSRILMSLFRLLGRLAAKDVEERLAAVVEKPFRCRLLVISRLKKLSLRTCPKSVSVFQ